MAVAAAAGHDVVRLLLEQTGPQLTRTYQRYSAQLASLPVDAKARVVRSLFLKSNGIAVEGGPVPGFSVTDIGGTWTGGAAYTPSLPSNRPRRPPSPAAAQYLVPAPGDPPAPTAAPTPGRRGTGMPDAELTVIANILLSTYGAELTLLKHLIDGASPVTGDQSPAAASEAASSRAQGASGVGAASVSGGGGSGSAASTPAAAATPAAPPASSTPDFNLLDVVDAVGDTTRHHLLSHFRQQGLVALAEFNTAALTGRFVEAGLAALAPFEAAAGGGGDAEGETTSAAASQLLPSTRAALATARDALAAAPASLWWPVRMYSDFDDTIAAKLFDTSFPGGTAYPGVVALYNAITRGSLPPPLPPPELLAAASTVLSALSEVGLLAKPQRHYEVHGGTVAAHAGWTGGGGGSAAAAAADLDAAEGLLRSSVAAFVEAGDARRARHDGVAAAPPVASPTRLPPSLSATWPACDRASPLPGRVVVTASATPRVTAPPSPGFSEPSLDAMEAFAEPTGGASVASSPSAVPPSTPFRLTATPAPSPVHPVSFTPVSASSAAEAGTPFPAPPPPFRAQWYNGINPSGLVFISARPSFLRANTVRAARAVGLDPVTVLCGTVASAWSRAAMARRKRDNYRRYHEALFPEYRSIWVGDAGQGDIRFGLALLEDAGHHHHHRQQQQVQQQQHGLHRQSPQHAHGAGGAGHREPIAASQPAALAAPSTPMSPGIVRRRSARDALQAAAKGWWSRHVAARTATGSPSGSGGSTGAVAAPADPWALDLVAFVAASLDPAASSKTTAAAALGHGGAGAPYHSSSPFASGLCLSLAPPPPLVLIHDIVTSKGLPYSAAYEGTSSSSGGEGEGVPRSRTAPLPGHRAAKASVLGSAARTGIGAGPDQTTAGPGTAPGGAGAPLAFPPSLAPGVRASLAARGVHVFDSYLDAAVVCAAAGADSGDAASRLRPAPLLPRAGLEEVLASATAEFSRVLPGLDAGRRAGRIAELQAAVGAALGMLSGPHQPAPQPGQGHSSVQSTPPPPRRS